MPDVFTADDARHWVMLTRAAFAARRAEIDALNVFPVPDGDTGTNLYLTLDGAISDTITTHTDEGVLGRASLVHECRTLARSVLLAARGNSGVIVSQVIGGLCAVVIEERAPAIDAPLLTRALDRGAEMARACVARPMEGTILTVADAAAAAAREAVDRGADLEGAAVAAVSAAREALARTPDLLPVLASAGVVDAGGAGCVLMLEALHRVVTRTWSEASDELLGAGPALRPRPEWHPGGIPASLRPDEPDDPDDAGEPRAGGSAGAAVDPGGDGAGAVEPGGAEHPPPAADDPRLLRIPQIGGHGEDVDDGFAFEVVYLVDETRPERVRELRRRLASLGDSLVVVGGPDLWKVHVHVDDVGAAIERGVEAGRLHGIHVTHFATQVAERAAGVDPDAIGVVACAAGPGIATLMEESGAVVLMSGPTARASAGQILDAIRETRSPGVIVLPNDHDTMLAAGLAARSAADLGITAHVVPARAAVQGLAALAIHEPGRSLHDNVVAMTGAAAATRHGAVSIAYKEALTWAGVCRPGDILGIVVGDIAFLGESLAGAAIEVLDRLLTPGGELVTLVVGADADAGLVDEVTTALRRDHPEIETVVIDGGQPAYHLLIGVE